MAVLPTATSWAPEIAGLPGESAYEIAVGEGFLGSEAQWLATLVGPAGAAGAQGIQGVAGINGADGVDGIVLSVVAGANVTVDATDPANPIVSASGGGGGSAGIASNWPSGATYFLNYLSGWADGAFESVGTAKLWIMPVDSDATFTGIEYSLSIADATAEVWLEIHTILGAGLPGTLVASLELDTTTAATGKTLSFAAPIAFPAGMYFFSLHTMAAGAGTGRLDSFSFPSTTGSPFTSSLLITNYWTFMASTSELAAVSLAETALPGGAFTPGANWTGESFINTDVVALLTPPIIGLIKQ